MKTGDRTFEQTASSLILSIFAVLGLWSVPTTLVCANDAVGLGSILVEGTLRTGQDNIISRLAKGEACVDSARDFATALADNPELEGWRIQQATNVTLGHTAVVVTSNETGNSYYVDNYFGHTEIELSFMRECRGNRICGCRIRYSTRPREASCSAAPPGFHPPTALT